MTREPAIIVGAVVGVVEAILAALVAVDVIALDIATEATIGVGALVAILQAWYTRGKVWSPASVERVQARMADLGGD